jgi:hypothetical protein
LNNVSPLSDRPYVDFPEGTEPPRAKPISVALPPLPKRVAMDTPLPERGGNPTEVLRCVARSYLVSLDELSGKDRHKNIAEARLVAYWLLRTLTKLSFPEIGRAVRRDHTSAMKGLKSVLRRRERDASFLAFTNDLAAAVAVRLEGPGA